MEKEVVFTNDNKNEFTGIINYLRMKFPDDLSEELIITSSTFKNDFPASNLVLYEDQNKYYLSENSPNEWICFDFKNNRIIPTEYTIRAVKGWESNYGHPRYWVIEVSNDSALWEVIDEQWNCSFLNGPSFVHTFSLWRPCSNKFRFLRIRQTSRNFGNSYYFAFDSFEIYGTLFLQNRH